MPEKPHWVHCYPRVNDAQSNTAYSTMFHDVSHWKILQKCNSGKLGKSVAWVLLVAFLLKGKDLLKSDYNCGNSLGPNYQRNSSLAPLQNWAWNCGWAAGRILMAGMRFLGTLIIHSTAPPSVEGNLLYSWYIYSTLALFICSCSSNRYDPMYNGLAFFLSFAL